MHLNHFTYFEIFILFLVRISIYLKYQLLFLEISKYISIHHSSIIQEYKYSIQNYKYFIFFFLFEKKINKYCYQYKFTAVIKEI